jgi:hypothetical protein
MWLVGRIHRIGPREAHQRFGLSWKTFSLVGYVVLLRTKTSWLGVLALKESSVWPKDMLSWIVNVMEFRRFLGGRRFGINSLGRNVIFFYGWLLKKSVLLGIISKEEGFRVLLFVPSVC